MNEDDTPSLDELSLADYELIDYFLEACKNEALNRINCDITQAEKDFARSIYHSASLLQALSEVTTQPTKDWLECTRIARATKEALDGESS